MNRDFRKDLQTALSNQMPHQSSMEQQKQALLTLLNSALLEFIGLLNEALIIVMEEMPEGSQMIGENNGVRFRDQDNQSYEGVLHFRMSADADCIISPPRQYQLPEAIEAFQTISSDHYFCIAIFSQRLPNIYNFHETSDKQMLYLTVPRNVNESWSMTIKTRFPDNESNRGRTTYEKPYAFTSTKQLVEFCVLQLIQAGKYKL